jgi:hypothetical protein
MAEAGAREKGTGVEWSAAASGCAADPAENGGVGREVI